MITLAQVVGTYSIPQMIVIAIIVAAVIAIGAVAIRAMGIAIPDWVVKIFWIVVIAVVAIFALRVLLSLV